jgi:leucyl-tRNA synthetase
VKEMDITNTFLTRREAKGYCFEIDVQNLLYTLGFDFEGNPVSEYAWKHSNIRHKVDIVLANGLRIECKHIDGKVYLSWFKRDWLPKGSCVFVFKGDLKLSPAIIEQYHPILVHYSLLHVYLSYNLPLFRGVTSFLEAISTKNVESEAIVTKNIRDVAKNVETRRYLPKTPVGDITHRRRLSKYRGEEYGKEEEG